MSINQLVFGHAATVVVQNPITGANLPLTNIVKFGWKQVTEKETSRPLNAPPILAHTPNGWIGEITFDRVDATIDTFFAQLEAAYWNNVLTYSGSIMVYLLEINKTTTQWQLTGATMTLSDAGVFESQKKITQRIDWEAAQRKQIL